MTEDLSKTVWDYFSAKGLNPFAISGILGNLYIESGLSSNKLEDSAQTRLKITSEEYTKMVDNGQYKNFVKDIAAYGIAQWKYYKRKESLYNFAKKNKKSISDVYIQLDFLWYEFATSYINMLTELRTCNSIYNSSRIVYLNFKNPDIQNTVAINQRAEESIKFYNKYAAPVEYTPGIYRSNNGTDYSSVFDPIYYYDSYADSRSRCGINTDKLFRDFLSFGISLGRRGNNIFDPKIYRANNPDLDEKFGDNWSRYYLHYIASITNKEPI